jgi:methylated-DNA-[protein]-cysteine S-methyltransferase
MTSGLLKNQLSGPKTLPVTSMKFDPSLVQTRVPSPLGSIIIAASAQGLAGLWFEQGQRYLPPELGDQAGASARWPGNAEHMVLKAAREQLAEYFSGQRCHFELPLDLSGGTAFQQSVWQALRDIAQGSTVSYSAIGQRIGKPSAVRAVGAAIARNPVSIIVPCHRVLGANGSLTGYAGGLERKTALLRLEGALRKKVF